MPTYMLKKLPLLPPCSAAERSPLALNFSPSHKLLRKLNFSFLLKMFTSIFFTLLQLGTFLASCWPVVLCSRVLLWVPCDESYLYYYTTSQYSVIHHMFFVQSCTRRISSLSLSQSKFPITSCVSFSSWVTTSLLWSKFLQPPKMLKVPHPPSYFPIDQWNYLRNSHYRVVTKGIPLTTVVLYVEFIYRSSSFGSHLS